MDKNNWPEIPPFLIRKDEGADIPVPEKTQEKWNDGALITGDLAPSTKRRLKDEAEQLVYGILKRDHETTVGRIQKEYPELETKNINAARRRLLKKGVMHMDGRRWVLRGK